MEAQHYPVPYIAIQCVFGIIDGLRQTLATKTPKTHVKKRKRSPEKEEVPNDESVHQLMMDIVDNSIISPRDVNDDSSNDNDLND